jgi:hypothetical protein
MSTSEPGSVPEDPASAAPPPAEAEPAPSAAEAEAAPPQPGGDQADAAAPPLPTAPPLQEDAPAAAAPTTSESAPPSPAGPPPAAFGGQPPPSGPSYPIVVDFDAPEHIARWRPLVQWILVIPHWILLYLLGIVAYVVTIIVWFAALFTTKVPPGLGSFLAAYRRYSWRVISYWGFLRADYPKFEIPMGYADPGGDPATFNVVEPTKLSRLAVLFRIILVIPQLIVLIFIGLAAYIAWVIAFFAVIITGRWPAGLRDFVVGAMRWSLRVEGWYNMLADPYPPYSLH